MVNVFVYEREGERRKERERERERGLKSVDTVSTSLGNSQFLPYVITMSHC